MEEVEEKVVVGEVGEAEEKVEVGWVERVVAGWEGEVEERVGEDWAEGVEE